MKYLLRALKKKYILYVNGKRKILIIKDGNTK